MSFIFRRRLEAHNYFRRIVVNEPESELQREIIEHRVKAHKLFAEVKWIREQLPALPFLKRLFVLRKIAALEQEAERELQNSSALEKWICESHENQ